MEYNILDQDVTQPQNIVYAGFWERVGASFIDFLIMIPVIVITVINAVNWKSLILSIILGLVWITYKIYLEGTRGNTIGKKAMRIRIVDANMQTINMSKSITRNCLYIINTIVGLASTFMIYNNADFSEIDSWMEYGRYQNENGMLLQSLVSIGIFISVIFVAFDSKKQALHDKIANTYCIKES
ncbi:MAG: RDD family protein [Fimbriimonadaceae bacterium]|nr:RDD family protein [Chitinophagales bacterium]